MQVILILVSLVQVYVILYGGELLMNPIIS